VTATIRPAARSQAALGIAAILAATACWSSGGVLVKYADQPGTIVAFWRLLIVAAVFGAICAALRREVGWRTLWRSLPGGLLFGANLAVWFEALRHTTVGIATVLGALVPVLALVVGNRFFGERIHRLAIGCAAGAVAGVVLFVLPGFGASGSRWQGLALAALAVVLWVAYLFVTKRTRTSVGTLEYLFCMALVAALSLLPFMALFTDAGVALPSRGWGWIVALALVPGCVGHGLLAWAQAYVPMSTAGILLQGEPVGAAIAGAVFLGEAFGIVQALGLAVTFAALAALTRAAAAATPD
jgi:drug/metabolite transporter (DMT)-like permease